MVGSAHTQTVDQPEIHERDHVDGAVPPNESARRDVREHGGVHSVFAERCGRGCAYADATILPIVSIGASDFAGPVRYRKFRR